MKEAKSKLVGVQKQALVKAEFKKTTQGRRKSNTNTAVVPEKVLNNLSDNCEGINPAGS